MAIDFSDSDTLYGVIGAGVGVLLLFVLGICCCRRGRRGVDEDAGPPIREKKLLVDEVVIDVDAEAESDEPRATKYEPVALTPRGPSGSVATITKSGNSTLSAHKHNSANDQRVTETQTLEALMEDPVIVASRLPFDTVMTHVLISKGGFGEVYKGSYRGDIIAVKRLLPESRRNLKLIAAFFTEIKMMAPMEHPRIVKYIGVAWDAPGDVCVVSEFMDGGDLRAVLSTFEEHGRPTGIGKQKATIALHVAHALTYMHSLQPTVLHRDLKSRNILLDATQWSAKLTDFGVSRERSDKTMTAAVGTLLWMAPEVMAGERYDEKADIFSFGVVLAELDTHMMPYADVKEKIAREAGRVLPDTALVQRIMSGRVAVTFSDHVYDNVRALGRACVSVDPAKRPTAAQVLYELHEFVRSIHIEYVL